MKFWLGLNMEPHQNLLALAQEAERVGFEGVVLPDHIVIPAGDDVTPHSGFGHPIDPELPFIEPLMAFAAMSAVTTRLRFLTGILVATMRDPFLLAKQMGTLALLSDNRFVLGTGVGWLREEFEIVHQGFKDRGSRMEEMLTVIDDLWDGWAESSGPHYPLRRSGMFPHPTKPLEIWVGATNDAGRRYIPMRVYDEQARKEFAIVDEMRAELGLSGEYERVAFWPGGERDTADRLRGEGITQAVAALWEPSSDLPLAARMEAVEKFAVSTF
jgi:alkanesulfonate monooxygenase SsuD/methylene tetrahydromethanopterin reductase-like flavin-dependent oxidoreductase (luciferase family)